MGKDLIKKYVNMTYFCTPFIFYSILLTIGVTMNEKEFENLKSQFVTSSLEQLGGHRKLPYAFTKK
jgi:hypothetical protein